MTGDRSIERLIDHDVVRVLVAIAEARSFTGAAKALGISQPAVSKHAQRLEAWTGRTLFVRHRHGIELTRDGEAALIYARAMQSLTREMRRSFEDSTQAIKIRIGMSEDFCRTALPNVLAVALATHPTVEIAVVSGTYDVLEAAVEGRRVDFAIMRRYAKFPHARRLWSDDLVWYGRREMRFPPTDAVPLVVPLSPNPSRDTTLDALQRAGRPWQIAFESVGMAGMEAALQAGLGVSAGPRTMRLYDVDTIDDAAGLPALPRVDFVMVGPDANADGPVLAFAELIRLASASNFRERRGATAR